MEAVFTGAAVFGLTFSASLLGLWMHDRLPQHHLDADSKDTIKLAVGLVATMAALVIGLVTASAKSTYDDVDASVKQTAVEILALDRVLARYGSDADRIRAGLKQSVKMRIDTIWPQDSSGAEAVDNAALKSGINGDQLADAIRRLDPKDDSQRALKARAQDYAERLLEARWFGLVGTEKSIPMPFLVAIVFWLMTVFWSFGLFSPRHATVFAVLLVCTVSVGSTIFLVLEMDSPFSGVLKISADPFKYVYDHLGL